MVGHALLLTVFSLLFYSSFHTACITRTKGSLVTLYVYVACNLFDGFRLTTNPIVVAKNRFVCQTPLGRYSAGYSLFAGAGWIFLSTSTVLILLSFDLVPLSSAISYSLLVRSFWLKDGVDRSFAMASNRIKMFAQALGPMSALMLVLRTTPEKTEYLINAQVVVRKSFFSLVLTNKYICMQRRNLSK